MGARLVGLALTRWAPHISDRAFRVLVRMALTALDEPTPDIPAGRYFGGRDLLLSVLRERDGTDETAKRTLKRAIAELVDVGAVKRTNRAQAGEKQCYELTLWDAIRIDKPLVDNPPQGDSTGTPLGDTSGPPQGDSTGTPLGDTSSPKWGTPRVPPRNHEEPLKEPQQEKPEDEAADLSEPVAVARATSKKATIINLSPACPHGCAKGYLLTAAGHLERCKHCNSNADTGQNAALATVIPFPARRSA